MSCIICLATASRSTYKICKILKYKERYPQIITIMIFVARFPTKYRAWWLLATRAKVTASLLWWAITAGACHANTVVSDSCTKNTVVVAHYRGSVPCKCHDRE